MVVLRPNNWSEKILMKLRSLVRNIFPTVLRVDNDKERNNHNLELSSFSQLFLLRIESLSHNLVPGGLGLSQLESVEVIESSSGSLPLQPLGPVRALPGVVNLTETFLLKYLFCVF